MPGQSLSENKTSLSIKSWNPSHFGLSSKRINSASNLSTPSVIAQCFFLNSKKLIGPFNHFSINSKYCSLFS